MRYLVPWHIILSPHKCCHKRSNSPSLPIPPPRLAQAPSPRRPQGGGHSYQPRWCPSRRRGGWCRCAGRSCCCCGRSFWFWCHVGTEVQVQVQDRRRWPPPFRYRQQEIVHRNAPSGHGQCHRRGHRRVGHRHCHRRGRQRQGTGRAQERRPQIQAIPRRPMGLHAIGDAGVPRGQRPLPRPAHLPRQPSARSLGEAPAPPVQAHE